MLVPLFEFWPGLGRVSSWKAARKMEQGAIKEGLKHGGQYSEPARTGVTVQTAAADSEAGVWDYSECAAVG